MHDISRTTLRRFKPHATALLIVATCCWTSSARASETGCGHAIALARARLIHADLRRLSRCALAAMQGGAAISSSAAEDSCRALRTPGGAVPRMSQRVHARIERRCRRTLPSWLPSHCPTPAVLHSTALDSANAVARCASASAHCAALRAAGELIPGVEEVLQSQDSRNLSSDLGDGFRLLDCTSSTSTSTTLPPEVTTTTRPATTTTISQPSTTLAQPTTTLAPTTTTLALPQQPSVVFTEVMTNPAAKPDSAGEYFEIRNVGDTEIDLLGMQFRDDGSDSFVIDTSLPVAAGAYVVFGRTAEAAGGNVDYVYGSAMSLTNSTDELILETAEGTLVDRLSYDGRFPLEAGRAMETAVETAHGNDIPENWCVASDELGDGDFGSPGTGARCGQ